MARVWKATNLDVMRTPSGAYKVYAWGSLGRLRRSYVKAMGLEVVRRFQVPGQPQHGWPEPVGAFLFLQDLDQYSTLQAIEPGQGGSMTGYQIVGWNALSQYQQATILAARGPDALPRPQTWAGRQQAAAAGMARAAAEQLLTDGQDAPQRPQEAVLRTRRDPAKLRVALELLDLVEDQLTFPGGGQDELEENIIGALRQAVKEELGLEEED